MVKLVQARIDLITERELRRLSRDLGWTTSQIIREGIRMLGEQRRERRRAIVGVGEFASGVSDLGSNKKHLRGFGK